MPARDRRRLQPDEPRGGDFQTVECDSVHCSCECVVAGCWRHMGEDDCAKNWFVSAEIEWGEFLSRHPEEPACGLCGNLLDFEGDVACPCLINDDFFSSIEKDTNCGLCGRPFTDSVDDVCPCLIDDDPLSALRDVIPG